MKNLLLGVDLGGTKTAIAVVTKSAKIIAKDIFPTPAKEGPQKVLQTIIFSIKNLLQKNDLSLNNLYGIGFGSPGQLDFVQGTVSDPPNLKNWKTVPVKKILEKEFKIRVRVDNDANAAALGELYFGAGKGLKYFIYITISSGIGGGIVIDGKLYRGFSGGAGEIGHMIIDENGPSCGCGNKGCLEALGAGYAITRRTREKIKLGRVTKISSLVQNDLNNVTPKIVEEAAKIGDQLAKEVWRETGYYIGIGVANLINIFNPQAIIIGGGIAKAGKLLFYPLRQAAKQFSFPFAFKSVRIIPAGLEADAGVLGAAALLLER